MITLKFYSGRTVEEYLTFAMPAFVDSKSIIMWIGIFSVLLFALMFGFWKAKQHKAFPQIAMAVVLIGSALIPVAWLGIPIHNSNLLAQSIASNYKVDVSSVVNGNELVAGYNGKLYPCSVASKDQKSYYVLCNVTEGKVLLNEITNGKFK